MLLLSGADVEEFKRKVTATFSWKLVKDSRIYPGYKFYSLDDNELEPKHPVIYWRDTKKPNETNVNIQKKNTKKKSCITK